MTKRKLPRPFLQSLWSDWRREKATSGIDPSRFLLHCTNPAACNVGEKCLAQAEAPERQHSRLGHDVLRIYRTFTWPVPPHQPHLLPSWFLPVPPQLRHVSVGCSFGFSGPRSGLLIVTSSRNQTPITLTTALSQLLATTGTVPRFRDNSPLCYARGAHPNATAIAVVGLVGPYLCGAECAFHFWHRPVPPFESVGGFRNAACQGNSSELARLAPLRQHTKLDDTTADLRLQSLRGHERTSGLREAFSNRRLEVHTRPGPCSVEAAGDQPPQSPP